MSCINLFHYDYCFNNRIIYIVMTKEQILQKLSLSKNIIDGISHNSNNKESCDAVSVLMEQVIQAISMSRFTSGADLTGQTFGQLTVLGVHSKVKWENTSGYIYILGLADVPVAKLLIKTHINCCTTKVYSL